MRMILSERRAMLHGTGGRQAISIELRFRVAPSLVRTERWEVQTFAYSWMLYYDNREEVAYHWDDEPIGDAGFREPHLHLGRDLIHSGIPRPDRDRMSVLAKAHLPTGHVPFTALLRTAIREFGVVPRREHGESESALAARVERDLSNAESALIESFGWCARSI